MTNTTNTTRMLTELARTAELGTLEHLDPRTLRLEDNVRDNTGLTKQFIASVKENGVLVPITGVRDPEDEQVIWVRTGQRRTLAAREAGLDSVPVYVLPARYADSDTEVIERVSQQITENDHRAQLTNTERVFGIQQLLDTGLSPTKAARKLARPLSYVKNAAAVAGSQAAIDALSSGQLSLPEAAAIVEFEDDEHALDRLLRCAGRPGFDHVVGELREQRAAEAARVAAGARFVEAGHTLLESAPAAFDPEFVPVHELTTTDGEEIGQGVIDDGDPAHWAVLLTEDYILLDAANESVAEEDVDWNVQYDKNLEPAPGKRHPKDLHEVTTFVPEYYCTDYAGAGLTPSTRFVELAGRTRFDGLPAGDGVHAVNGEDQDEVAAQREKRERSKVLALNKLGAAAEGVRREFVTKLLARKSPPKGAAMFIATILAGDPHLLTVNQAEATAVQLLGATERSGYGKDRAGGVPELLANATDARAIVVTLGLVLGALEAQTPKDAWRGGDYSYRTTARGPYLEFLVANGYTLAPVEEIVTGKRKADKVYDAHLADK